MIEKAQLKKRIELELRMMRGAVYEKEDESVVLLL